jgi:uncharacterized OB-fold protein
LSDKEIKPLTEGLFITPKSLDEKIYLIGSRCNRCGEIYFPKKTSDFCVQCQQSGLDEIKLSRKGHISAFTIAFQAPAGGFYNGPVPYAFGFVDLPEGVRIQTQFSRDFEMLKIGKKVELAFEKLAKDNYGHDIVSYVFNLVQE